MKRILWFIAGLVSGIAVTLWWGGRKREHDEDIWKKHIGNVVADLNKDMCKVIRRVEELQTADADLPKYCFGTPIDPQPSNWRSEDGWVIGENGFQMKVLGVWDRVLTADEVQRLYEAGEDGIVKSLADTQPIRTSDV
jgi:hypothetical protein